MPHQNIFRCHIKRPGPRAGTKTAVPVGRARTPASPPFATNRTAQLLSLQFYPPERERRPPACIYGPLLPVRPLELQPQNCADRLRSRSPSAQPSGASSRGPHTQCPPPGSDGGENITGSAPGNNPSPEDGLPARRAGKAEAVVAPAVPRLGAVPPGYTAIRRGDPPAPAAAKPRHAICDTIRITLAFLPPVVLSIAV